MRSGPQAVARVLGKRLGPLLVLLAVLALVGDPRSGGVQAGLIFAAACGPLLTARHPCRDRR
ncbi:MAG: hypothetical protein SGJ23_12050, partial [Alphaproteobacteria bacterium]|nr:hypothetical protein [Alphaproteobacteria bacterium]